MTDTPHIGIDGMLINRCVSGVEHAIYNLAAALADAGRHTYELYMPDYSPQPDITSPRLRTHRCHLPGRSRIMRILWEQTRLPRVLKKQACNLLHAPGYIAPFCSGLPTVITVYDLIALRWPKYCKRTNVVNYRLQLPLSIRCAAGISVPSEATRRDLVSRFPFAVEKTRVIPLAITNDFQPVKEQQKLEDIRHAYKLPPQFILFVGQLEPKKNIPTLIRAFAELKAFTELPHKLVLAGGRGWHFDGIERALRKCGASNDILFTGFVPGEDLPALFSLADLFVFPSFCEGFGIPPLEAMACGTPVVTSNATSLPEVVGKAALLLDEPADSKELARLMQRGLTDKNLRSELITRGQERAKQFTWEKTAQATELFYDETVAVCRT
ncbi:MAG: glycosyltransferase family 4 protein [Candidatus Pacebacteria bacterium]|nr:glycosyltransferase family 4 protein [Candidatus Paceibacterota bacterium]